MDNQPTHHHLSDTKTVIYTSAITGASLKIVCWNFDSTKTPRLQGNLFKTCGYMYDKSVRLIQIMCIRLNVAVTILELKQLDATLLTK